MTQAPGILTRQDGTAIAYHGSSGRGPTVLFLGGFRSDMTGTKATTLERFCRERGQAFLRFDYSGHGASSGDFLDGTIGGWTEDALTVIDRLTGGPLILVGSSMGGWIMLLAALRRRERVAGLVGIAAAPDFTEDLMWERFSPDIRSRLMREGLYHEPSEYSDEPYPVTLRLIEEGRRHLLLRAPISLTCPVRLLHGMRDADVPWQTSTRLVERLAAEDAVVTLAKDGDHRLSREQDLARLCGTVGALCDELGGRR